MSSLKPHGNFQKQAEKAGKKRKKPAVCGNFRKESEKLGYSRIRDQKAAGKGFDDRQWWKFHRILSQPIGSELHSVESRPYRLRPEGESRHFDSPGHCKSMLPGFCFSCGFSAFSEKQPAGLQRVAKALVWQAEKITSGNFRIFPAFSALKMSTLIFLVTIPDRWTICFSFVKIITEKSNG